MRKDLPVDEYFLSITISLNDKGWTTEMDTNRWDYRLSLVLDSHWIIYYTPNCSFYSHSAVSSFISFDESDKRIKYTFNLPLYIRISIYGLWLLWPPVKDRTWWLKPVTWDWPWERIRGWCDELSQLWLLWTLFIDSLTSQSCTPSSWRWSAAPPQVRIRDRRRMWGTRVSLGETWRQMRSDWITETPWRDSKDCVLFIVFCFTSLVSLGYGRLRCWLFGLPEGEPIDRLCVCFAYATPYVTRFALNDMERVINRNIRPMDGCAGSSSPSSLSHRFPGTHKQRTHLFILSRGDQPVNHPFTGAQRRWDSDCVPNGGLECVRRFIDSWSLKRVTLEGDRHRNKSCVCCEFSFLQFHVVFVFWVEIDPVYTSNWYKHGLVSPFALWVMILCVEGGEEVP